MLKSWQVEHFKSIGEARTLEPGRVTILTGLNNSGKSSFLQSILMIADTLSNSPKEHPLLPATVSRSGVDNDILSDTATDRTLSFDFELILPLKKDEHMPAQAEQSRSSTVKVAVSFRFEPAQHTTRFAIGEYGIKFSSSTLPVIQSLSITFPQRDDGNEEVAFRLDTISEQVNQEIPAQVFTPNYRLPQKRSLSYHGHFYVNGQQIPGTYQVQEFVHFLPLRVQLLPDSGERHSTSRSTKKSESKYPTLLMETVKRIEYFFSQQVHYLGPQRTNFSPYQPPLRSGTSRSDNVGPKGEYAAALYHSYPNKEVSWYDPGSLNEKSATLKEALDWWVQYLGIASNVKTEQIEQGALSWQVALSDGKFRPLSSGGDSISQVLPLLVLGLLASPGSLLLVEQPELFLHQNVQARLGDFFVSLAMSGKQWLIETQSENLVTQLRYHIVREGGHDPHRYMLYFTDRDEKGCARFTPIEISPRGTIVNWPEGFFSETLIQEENIRFAYMKNKFETQAEEAGERRVVQKGGEQAQDAGYFG